MNRVSSSDVMYTWRPESDADPPVLGGKAAALRVASEAGFAVPDWMVIGPAAFTDSLTPEMEAKLQDDTLTAADLDVLAPSPPVREAIETALKTAFGADPHSTLSLAVRSSAPEEDAAEHSFAGQLESYLYVPPHRVADRVADVWRSAFQESVLDYRTAQGLEGAPPPPAVLVQAMRTPDRAGVAFSADPSTGQRGVSVVAAVVGAGTVLVDGTEDGDTYRIDRSGTVVDREVRTQTQAHRPNPDAEEGGVVTAPLPEEAGSAPALTDDEAEAVADLARRVERCFGRPMDIEWALEDDTLYLLQARPITQLADQPDPDAPLRVWDNSNIAESYSGVTTPLTFTFARRAYDAVYRAFLRLMRVPSSVIDAHDATFRAMIGLVKGRIYYNLLNWYEVLSLLPGFQFNRAFMEEMMGVRERLPEELLPERTASSVGEKIRDAVRLVWSALHLIVEHWRLPRRIDAFYRHLDATVEPPAPGLEQMRLDELADFYRHLEDELLERWDVPIANDFFAMIFFGLSKRTVERWGGAASDLHNQLLTGHGEIVSTEPARRMRRMAEDVAGDEGLVQTLLQGSLREIEAAVDDRPELRKKYEAYLKRFSDRCLDELKLESPTLRDDPTSLWRAVASMARRMRTEDGLPEPGAAEREMRAAAEATLQDALSGRPVRRWITRWTLRNARDRVAARENLRFERTRVFGLARRIFVEMGRRLAAQNVLTDPRDVFYLEREELLGVVEGTSSTCDLQAVADARRAEFDRYREAPPPPDRFRTRGAAQIGRPLPDDASTADRDADEESGNVRSGLGACPGVVRGPVRVVTDPRNVSLDPDEILVAQRTDPGWITLFATARGLVVERGSLLSHAAIVSREMGLPSVVSLPGVTDWLQDGDVVEIDGEAGTVRKV